MSDTATRKRIAAEMLGELAEQKRRGLNLPKGVFPILVLVDPQMDVAVWNTNIGESTARKLLRAVAGNVGDSQKVIRVAQSVIPQS
jgi:hypothetical protein